jgi:hypothetical protein
MECFDFRLSELYWIKNPNLYACVAPTSKKQFKNAREVGEHAATHVTSLIHSSIAAALAFYITFNKSLPIHADRLFADYKLSQLHGVHTAAVFFTELLEMINSKQYKSTMEMVMIFHHSVALYAFSSAAYGVGTFYLSMILLAETSNPFLALRWMLLTMNQGSTKLFKFVEYSFAISFFAVRMVLSYLYITPIVVGDLWAVAWGTIDAKSFPMMNGHDIGYAVFIARSCLSLLPVYHAMNAFFFSQILRALARNFQRTDKTTEAIARPTSKSVLMDN